MSRLSVLVAVLAVMFFVSCGVNKDVHKKTVMDLQKTTSLYKKELAKNKDLAHKLRAAENHLKKMKKGIESLMNEKMLLSKEKEALNQKFLDTMKLLDSLKAELTAKGSNLEELTARQAELQAQREKMEKETKNLREELARLKKAAELRNLEFQKVMGSLKKMIDAGTLTVKIRKGRMIVSLSSDILFPSGRTTLTEEGKSAITELSTTLSTLDNRAFLVVGHSDSTPIHTKRFPSNWELSTQRAIEVVRLMINSGVKPEMLTAGGAAEFDPIAPNDTPENKAKNRRVEIIFLPKLDELPGFAVNKQSSEQQKQTPVQSKSPEQKK